MKELCVVSKDAVFARYLELILSEAGAHVTVRKEGAEAPEDAFLVVDADSAEIPRRDPASLLALSFAPLPPEASACLRLTRPFRPARLLAVLGLSQKGGADAILPLPASHALLCGGERIDLTPTEFCLFSALWEAKGAFVSKEDLHRAVWNGEGDEGIVGVYIHYLRQKLEKGGVRYILSSRREGYALAEGGAAC